MGKGAIKQIDPLGTKQQTIYNVTSNNQSGGITAGVVHFSKPGRHINDKLKEQLDQEFPNTHESVRISVITGNGEALTFAEEIRQYLNTKGVSIGQVGQFMGGPLKGQKIAKDKDGIRHIKVGIQV
ncbi:MAG TPA: hypothetical protein VLC28_04780 [Flavitalea sp.]|nr:hypothetical protein [Flavitalea sp.]